MTLDENKQLTPALGRGSVATPPSGRALRLERRPDGQLWATARGANHPVSVRRCFPWSSPGKYISLRDGDDEEVGWVRDLAELDPRSRAALGRALVEAGFVLEIEKIHEVEDEIEIRTFDVHTRQGPRRFQTLRDEWPRELPGGGLLIRDVAGDLYFVRDPGSLDRGSRRRFWAFVD